MRIKIPNPALVKESKCVICKRIFFKRIRTGKRKIGIENIRKRNCTTCSKECAKIRVQTRDTKKYHKQYCRERYRRINNVKPENYKV